MEHNKHCYLLDLPVELRTLIYEYLFSDSEGSLSEWPPLLKVNKQIYKEGIAAHYAHTHFHFNLSTQDKAFQIYSKLPSPYKTSISHLYCDEPCWRFSAKGAASTIRQIHRQAEMELGPLPAGFIRAVMRASGESPVYTDDPVALARRMRWQQIDWDGEFRRRHL